MNRFFLFLLLYFFVFQTNAQESSTQPLQIGEIKTVYSSVLNEERRLNVYLPDSIDRTKSYPVIYLLDGSYHEDFLHIAGLVQFYHMTFQMPEVILIGIENIDRKRDFTHPTTVEELKQAYPTTGHSDPFIQFVETELKPYVEQQYKTNGTNYLIGQSLGGLLATEILLKKPELFSHYLIISPSLWWDDQSLINQADGLIRQQTQHDRFVYIAVGGKEHPIMQKDAAKLAKILSNYQKITFNKMKSEDHASILHNSIYQAFHQLFSGSKTH